MELSTHRRIPTVLLAGLFAATALALNPTAAHATRLPADPITTFVSSPVALTRMVTDAQARNTWAAVIDAQAR